MPKASIIIPTFNRLARLKIVITALEQQTIPLDDFEVIVVSDGSSDGTDQYLQSYTQPLKLRAYFQKNQGPAAARNLGVHQATGEIAIFLDDDVVPIPELVYEHLQLHAREEKLVVLGPMLTPPGIRLSPWTQWEQDMLMKQYKAMQKGEWQPTARQFYTGNSSLSRHYIGESGGFNTSLRRAEDVELAYRLETKGLRFYFHPQAIGYHYAKRSYQAWRQIAYDYGVNDVIFHQSMNHTWVLPNLFKEFETRNYGIRVLTWLCLDRPRLSSQITQILKTIILASNRLSFRPLSIALCSAIFNLRYYQGVCDTLGGRKIFYQRFSSWKTGQPV